MIAYPVYWWWYGAIAGVAMSVWGTGIMFWGVWLYRCMEIKKVGADFMTLLAGNV